MTYLRPQRDDPHHGIVAAAAAVEGSAYLRRSQGSTTGTTVSSGSCSEPFVTYQFPIDVKINTQLVGGPSAGLAFTLAIIDDLTPGA